MSKVVLISGSSGGIGRAVTKKYIENNYLVIGLDVNSDTQEEYIHIDTDLRKFVREIDYRAEKTKEIKSNITSNVEKFIIINNAATQILNPLENISLIDWDETLSINTLAPFFLIQQFRSQLIKSKGHVINVSSIHSKLTKSNFTCYASSKAALDSLTRSLALELSPLGVSVNSVAPGAIETEMLSSGFKSKKQLDELKEFHPANTIGNPEHLADFIKQITDQKGGFLTGSVLDFNGGIGIKLSDPN